MCLKYIMIKQQKKHMEIFTFSSFKGGTAKTSTALHIGACLAKFHKKKVLLVDFDSQANLSSGLGVLDDVNNNIISVLQYGKEIKDVIQPTSIDQLSLITANSRLDRVETTPELRTNSLSYKLLSLNLNLVKSEFDFCFIDTPPSLGWLTQSAFFASKKCILCTIPEVYSILALDRLREFQENFLNHHQIEVFGIVMSMWDTRGAINKDLLLEVESSFPKKIFQSKVRRDVSVSRCTLRGETVFDFDQNARVSEDYKMLTKEFVNRLSVSRTRISNVEITKPK